ncbi:MAG: aminotransferase class I/II-fold pyridoxal phosphate-dependent enzyme [Desulfarculaceae bacterium]|nr:aminotransferase class I/II-fold pyridoxal phosphate-dependent enzyme [Desulfarculaceae bacterium]
MITGHGGNVEFLAGQLGCAVNEIADMSSNLNPLGPPDGFEKFLADHLRSLERLPEADASTLTHTFCGKRDIDPETTIAANGTTWFIYTLPLALASEKVLISGPTYSDYRDGCISLGISPSFLTADTDADFCPDLSLISRKAGEFDTVFLCNPNNPTGSFLSKNELVEVVKQHPDTMFVLDESYLPFVPNAEKHSLVPRTDCKNLIVLSSMSKIFTVPGMRIGFLTAHPDTVEKVMRFYQPWSVNALAQKAGIYLLETHSDDSPFLVRTRKFIQEERELFRKNLENVSGIRLFPSAASFLLARVTCGLTAEQVCQRVGRNKILIRNCSNFRGLGDGKFVRFSLKDHRLNLKLADILRSELTHAL